MKAVKGCCADESTGKGSEVRMPPEEIVRRQAEYFKALSDPARVRIVYALRDQALCVCEIMELLDMPQTMVSHHCKILKYAGIVIDQKSGKWVNYSLADKNVLAVLELAAPSGR
jgi:DNA-binding transcriptional ArsR family regulator